MRTLVPDEPTGVVIGLLVISALINLNLLWDWRRSGRLFCTPLPRRYRGRSSQETDRQVQQDLAHAALSHFAWEAIEPVRQLLSSQRLDFELRDLRVYLVETCTIMDERFREFDEWRAAGEREREEHRQHMKTLKDDPMAALAA